MTRPRHASSFQARLRRALDERRAAEKPEPGFEYAGPADFVRREGRWFVPRVDETYKQGGPKLCFTNAIHGAVLYGLRYVEGYATSIFYPDKPVHHAWNLDPEGRVVDLTWGLFGDRRQLATVAAAYLGVEFSVERADDSTWNGDAAVIIDRRPEVSVLRKKWAGEPPGLVWPSSPRLEAVAALRDGDPEPLTALLLGGGEL